MENLYDTLGVERTASQADIRKAYRSRAQQLHPDKENGDKDKFQKLQKAYDILSDASRRQKYDETGSVGEGPTVEEEASRGMVQIFEQVLDNEDEETTNLIDRCKKQAQFLKQRVIDERTQCQRKIAKRERALHRLRPNADVTDTIGMALHHQIGALKNQLEHHKFVEQVFDRILEMIGKYGYEHDRSQVVQPVGMHNNSFGTFFSSTT